jgi:hypothetical protein
MRKILTYDNSTDLCPIRRTVLMPGPFPKYPIHLTPEQERHLQQFSSCYTAPFAEVQFEVRIYWLPTHASGLEQVDLIFSKVQRDVLTPNDFPGTLALEKHLKHYCDELNRHPKPIQWTYTKTKLLAKFGAPQPVVLAA